MANRLLSDLSYQRRHKLNRSNSSLTVAFSIVLFIKIVSFYRHFNFINQIKSYFKEPFFVSRKGTNLEQSSHTRLHPRLDHQNE